MDAESKFRVPSEVALTIKGDVRRLRLKPGDLVVIDFPNGAGEEYMLRGLEEFKKILERSGLHNQVVCISDRLQLSVVTP